MVKFLYIDFQCPVGHVPFNIGYITAFNSSDNVHVDYLFQKGYSEYLKGYISDDSKLYEYPLFKRKRHSRVNGIKFIIHQIMMQRYANEIIKKSNYDAIFVSSFDNLPFSVFRPVLKTLAVCHSNLDQALLSKWKLLLFRNISKRVHLITINENANLFLSKINIEHFNLPHGLSTSYSNNTTLNNVIFVPINEFVDYELYQNLLTSKFDDFLSKCNLRLIIKVTEKISFSEKSFNNIVVITGYIERQEFRKYMQDSLCIFLPYSVKDYAYRMSGLFMESISNNKRVIIPDINVFTIYLHDTDYGMFCYKNFDELTSVFKKIGDERSKEVCYNSIREEMAPKAILAELINML